MFSCGTEALDGMANNCERCALYDAGSAEKTKCDFSNKIAMGCFGAAPSKEEGAEYNCTGDPSTVCSKLVSVQPDV